jgi:hypothetical protein
VLLVLPLLVLLLQVVTATLESLLLLLAVL